MERRPKEGIAILSSSIIYGNSEITLANYLVSL